MMKPLFTSLKVLGVAALSAITLSSCGGDDSEDLSGTIPVIPETTLTGYELRGSILLVGSSEGVYENTIEAIGFVSGSMANILYKDKQVLQTSYSYSYTAATETSGATATITIDVPADELSETSSGDEDYILVISSPSTYYQVQLDGESNYKRVTALGTTSLPLYALNGSLNFTQP